MPIPPERTTALDRRAQWPRSSKRDEAKKMLVHYFNVFSANIIDEEEVASIVDVIVDAAVEEIRTWYNAGV